MNQNYKQQKNNLFILICLLGLGYAFLLTLLVTKTFSGFAMQLLLIAESVRDGQIAYLSEIFSRESLLSITIGMFALILMIRFITSFYQQLARIVRTQRFLRILPIIKANNNFTIFKHNKPTIFTAGIVKPETYISASLKKNLSPDKLEAVLLHEQYHQRMYDPLKNFLIVLIADAFPPFPQKKHLFDTYSTVTELACDQHAYTNQNSVKPTVEALAQILGDNHYQYDFNLSQFINVSDRVSILVGKSKLRIKRVFVSFLVLFFLSIAGSVIVTKSSVFVECKHILTCIEMFIDNNEFDQNGGHICVSPQNESAHCSSVQQL